MGKAIKTVTLTNKERVCTVIWSQSSAKWWTSYTDSLQIVWKYTTQASKGKWIDG